MTQSFKVVDAPQISGGKAAEPNPFEPAAKAAIQAQEQGKAIAFDLDTAGFADVTKTTTKDGVETTETKTAAQQAEAYVVRKIRELGKPMDRTFTVLVHEGTVTVAARERITRTKKVTAVPPVAVPDSDQA